MAGSGLVSVPETNRMPSSFTTTHKTDGLPGWGALDWFRPAGTIVGLPVGGTVERLSGSAGSSGDKVYGRSLYVRTDEGQRLFLTHFSDLFVRVGQRLGPGDPIGRVAPYGRASHIHVASQGAADRGDKVRLDDGQRSGRDPRNVEGAGPLPSGGGGIVGGAAGAAGGAVGDAVGAVRSVGDLIGWISDPANLARIAQLLGGSLLLVIGLVLLGRQVGGKVALGK